VTGSATPGDPGEEIADQGRDTAGPVPAGEGPAWEVGAPGPDPAAVSDVIADALRGFPRRTIAPDGRKAAAVGVTLTVEYDGLAFLLTRRAARLRGHAKQWALPGGRADPGETPGEAARRELAEELGLHLGPDAELGLLDDYATRSGYVMTPVVLWAGDAPHLVPSPAEVASVHRVPVADIDVDPVFVTIPESDAPVIRLPLFDGFVHAPTAAILHQFREVVLRGRPTRVAHLEQPVFAWR
jgi:8-oxo-dGTP pyrophosphatase MutT (NUDIX family)